MADLWYYTRDGKAMDPVSEAELKKLAASGDLQPTDLVWKEGMAKWVRAGSAKELYGSNRERPESAAQDNPDSVRGTRNRKSRFDDDDDYDDRRRPRRRYDEDDYDRPRRKKGLSTGAKVGITLGIVAGVLVLGGGILAIVLLSGGSSGGDFTAPFTTNNRLTWNDSIDHARRIGNMQPRCKIYNVKMNAGTTYSIILRAPNFDAYLRLEDSRGKRLAENDDGWPGINLDSHILFTPPVTGTYRVYATSLVPATGEFTLSVQNAGFFQK
ncbi:MAG TPA: GYF domain-containing protein [Gemmataceae bacterium]|nr:GYF domain-containing protein [Gemmataceae bacterium]